MNVCINEQSIKDFVKLFKSQAKLINNKTIQSKEQLYKRLYNAALMKSGDANNQSNIDLVVQHMLFLPIALNGSFPGLNIEADLAKTMTAMNSTKAVSDLIKDYQKLIVDTIDVEENPIEYSDENIVDFSKFNPVHVEVLTNQTPEFTGTEKKLDPNQTEAFAFIRAIIGDVKELTETPYKVLAIKLGAANALLNKLGLDVDRSLIGGSVTSPQALVFLMTDANGKIISYNTKTNKNKKVVLFSSYTNTPELLFEGYDWKKSFAEQKGFADTTANKKIRNVQEKLAKAIKFNNKEMESGEAMKMAFVQLANEFQILNDINKKANQNKAEGFLLDVNPTTSNFGYIDQNSGKETKITDVKDYNQFDVTTKQELTENGKVKFEFFALTGHTLHDVPVSLYPTSLDTNPELINALVELLTNPNLAVNGAVQTDEQRMDLFKKYVNVDSKTPIKFKKDNSISVGSKSFKLFDEGLKEALTDHFTKFSVKQEFVGKTEGKNIITDITEAKSKNDIFKTVSGKFHTVGKPNFSFKIKPENTYKMEGDNLILTPISRNAHIINNSYTIAETTVDNELRVYHPRIGFSLGTVVPVTAEKEVEVEVEDEVTPAEDVEPTPPTFEDNDDYADELLAANTIELETVTEKAEAAALKWFKNHDMSSELDLEFTDKKHPHALAQWFTSGITLYKGSNNTLIYHEAWHAFTQGILTKEQKNKLYFEVKKSYPNENFKNDKEVEEFLAEKFRAYAMDKISPKGNLLQQFFKNILDAITKIFKKKTLTDKYFQDLVDNKVDFSKYNPQENMFWGTMNASITAFSDPKAGKLDAAQSKLIVDTVNTLVNEAYSEKIKNGNMKITTLDDITPLYKHAKTRLIELKENQLKIQEELSKISTLDAAQKMKIAQVAKQVEALTFSIAEFGNLDDIEKNISDTGANTGVIGAHISSGLFITQQGLKSIAEEDTDRDETDPFKERKDISLEEYADKEILMLLSTVPDFDEKGNKVTNALGVHLLSNKVKVLSIVAKQTMSSANPDTMFAALKVSKDPIIQEVLKRMPLVNGELPIHLGSQILWSKFFQTFSKSNMPLKQLLFERVNDGKEVGINLKYGSVSSSTTQVRNNWNTAFESTPNIDVDIHGPYLNVKKALEWLEANPKATSAQKFNALGVNITDTKEVNKILKEGNKDSGIPAGILDDFIARLKNDTSINTTDFEKRINNITDLIKDYSVLNVDEQGNESYEKVKGLGGFYKTLQEVEFKYSNNYNSFMGTNAEGETASELVLNSSITHMINEMNNAEALQDLLGNNAFEHLDGNVDPFKKANTFLSEMFDEDGNRQTTKQGNVKLEYENFSGTKYFEKIIGDNEFENIVERGLSNMSLDENSKFITDVYLSYFGKAEAPRMADKSSSFHFGLSNYKPTFNLTAAKAIKSQADTNDVMYNALEKYLAAEIVRINTLGSAKGNIDKKYKARGQDFFIFDGLLTGSTKTTLKDNIKSTNFDEVLSEVRKSRTTLTKEINQYFKEKTDITLKNKKDTFYLAEGIRKELSGNAKTKLPIDESKELLISMFERNQFLNYLNFTTLFLGDPALYDVTKEDFHKRIAGVISTGEGFRHDLSMLETLNTLPFKSGGVVENNKSRNYAQSRIKSGDIKPKQEFREYDGTVVTAIINDHKVNSVYLDELAKDIKDSLGPYSGMNEADGQGFISFDFYRMLSISQGLWSPVKEAMYNNIVNGVAFDQTRVSEFFESMKLQHFGPVKTDGLPGMAFHKFNLIPLIPNMIKGTKLEDLHDKMMEQGIDYMTFASGSKLTSVSNSESESPNDDYYNKETRETTTDADFKFTPNIIHVKYLKNQIKIHNEFKGKITLPTQMRAILYAGLMNGGVPKDSQQYSQQDWEALSETEKLKSKDYTWLKKYEDTIDGIVSFKKQELFNELGITEEADISRSSEKLANLIRSELTRSEIDDAQIDFLFNNSALKTDISLALTEGQVSKMLVSLIDKRLTKMKVNGEGLIQMASTMSEKKGSQWKKATTEEQLEYGTNGLRSYYRKDGKIKAMQVKIALQGDFEKLLYIKGKDGKSIATYITKIGKDGTKVKTLDYDTTLGKLNALMVDPVWKKENMDLFIMTTCRIPGQAMNSVEFMEIHSFLPKIAGNVIILPSEIVAKSGADYDVDKLFTMMANLGLYNGSVKKIKALPKEDINELNSKITGLKERISNKKKELFDFIEANKDTLDEKQNLAEIKEARKSLKVAIASTPDKLTTKEKKALAENEKEVASLNAIIDSIYNTLGQKSSLFDELNAMNSELGDLQIRKDGQSIKGLENDLIDVIVERLEREDNYADLVRPNDTNLVDQIAKDLESVVTPFNKYQVVHGNAGTKISGSMIFDPSYNRNKQIENSVGKDTLGIGAVINKYFSMFTRMGMYTNIDSNALTLDEFNQLYNAKPGTLSKGQLDLVKSYKNYNLHFPNFNTKTVNGKQVVDLSSLKNNAGEYIPDILGQMINGWVDVAKGGWIFNIQGNKEATPTLLYLFMAGVPVKDAVNFVSVPAIRNYLEAKRVQQGALHVLNQSTTFAPGNKDALLKYKDIDAYKSVVGGLNIDSNTKEIYTDAKIESLNKIMTLSINDNAPINTNAIEESLNTKGLNPLSDDVQFDLLNKFIAYENIAQQITSLTTATTFDTKASSRLNEVRDKQKKLDSLVATNSALPVDVLKRIDSTVVGKFASTNLILKLFSNFSALKNNSALVKAAESKSKEAFDNGVFPEDNINQYQEDFIWYLYQNESNRITDNTYKGINLVEDESVDKYDYKDGELRYNPIFLNELAFGNDNLNTIEHRFGSKNAALKFLAEYGSIDSVDLPKDSMHYTMAKKALSDLGINENTIEGKEITPEEYEELIAVAALESKALLASGNRATLMHGPFSYAKRLLEVVSEHGELKGNFKFLQDVRHNYNKYSHNISLANNKETGYSKIYRQELEILKAYGEIPEVQELFEQFDHFAVLQSGIRTSGQFNVTEIIDPAHISNVIGNQYNSILESLNKLNTGEAKNYSVLDLFTELNYPVDYAIRQLQNKRGGSYENDNYFKNEIEYTNKFDLSYLEGVRKIEIAMAKYATSAIIMPYAALSETEDAARQLEYFTALGERNINFELGLYATAYINSSSEITDPKFVKEYFNKYKNHLDKLNHDNNLTFNIEMKPGANELIIAHLESLGYKKHPMLSSNGLYYAMSKVDSMPVSGLYNTQNTFSIKDDSLLSSSNKNEVVKVSIDQLVSKQLSDKYGLEEKYQAHKSLPNANWSEFIKANVIDNVAIESAYKYVVGKVIEKDKSFKSLLTNTQDAVLLQGDGQDKLNNMYARALMTARKSLVQIKAVESDPQQKAAVLTTSSGFLSAGTLPGFKRVEEITGAEIFDGEVFNKVESDKLFEIMDKEFPKVLAEPAQRDANFANTKSIYFGPIEYKYSTITKAPAALPSWLDKTVRELEKRMGVIPGYFDTALINRYTGLEQGLGMHTDAEPNLVGKENINPTVLTLSLGAERIFRLEGMSNTPYVNEKVGIPTKQGHVLVMGKDSQIKYKHGIEKNSGQAGIRYSITLRHTPDVNPVGRAIDKSTSSVVSQQTANPSDYTNHSGGAYGGDTFWDMIGREFGVSKHMHYKDAGNANLSQKLKNAGVKATVLTKEQMDKARTEVERLLGEKYPDTLQGNLQVRNYYQVANADAVFAVAEIKPTTKPEVIGGTNTAVQLGIKMNKPVYVFDLDTKKWYTQDVEFLKTGYDKTKHEWNYNGWKEINTPTLTKNFAGVGSRDIESYNVQKEGKWVPREQYKGPEVEAAAKQAIRDVYANTFSKKGQTSVVRKTYSGNVTSLQPNQVFVFGSNPEGKHGKGAAKAAVDNFGAVYGQGEGIQGQSYALPTKDLRVKENNSLKSISPETITSSIKKLYDFVTQNPTKEFLVSDYSGTNLNGYTGQEMADMFNAAGPIPSNIVFNENFDKLISEKPTTTRTEDSYQYYGKPYAIVIENGVGVDVVGYKGKAVDKSKLLAKYNENPNVDPQNGKAFRTEPTPVKAEPTLGSKPKTNRYELFPGVFANQGQSEAIDKLYDFISSKESEFVLEGAGGTGKTTLIKNLVDELQSKGSVLAVGPTHKAKRVLDKSLNKNKNEDSKIKTVTLASALAIKLNETNGKFEPDTFKRQKGLVPIRNADFVIIDEASMLSDEMLSEINQWKKNGAKVIYMGDRAQLPPVGQNADSKVFGYSNHYMLLEKMRQAATSPIIGIGTVVSDNVKSSKPETNIITTDMMVNTKDSVSGSELLWEQNEANAINQFVDDIKNSDDPNYAKIVTFNNEKNTSGQSVLNLNIKVRNALYGLDAVKNQFMPGERLVAYDTFGDEAPKFTNGEDLVVINNIKKTDVKINIEASSKAKGYRSQVFEYDVEYLDLLNEDGNTLYNIPVIASSSINKFEQDLNLLFKNDPQLGYSLLSEFGNLHYGYAITSHKAQGSTYTNTYVMLDNILGNTNLGTPKAKNQSLYVAVSRPSTKLVMVTKTAPLDPKSITVGAEKSKYDNDKIGC